MHGNAAMGQISQENAKIFYPSPPQRFCTPIYNHCHHAAIARICSLFPKSSYSLKQDLDCLKGDICVAFPALPFHHCILPLIVSLLLTNSFSTSL